MVDEIQRDYEALKAVFSEGSGGRREAPQGRVDPKAVACLSIPAGSSALTGLGKEESGFLRGTAETSSPSKFPASSSPVTAAPSAT